MKMGLPATGSAKKVPHNLVRIGTLLSLLGLMVAIFAPAGASAQSTSSNCQFVMGFKDLHDADPSDVGDCMDNQVLTSTGAEQHTTKGLLAWRRVDNWTAFTNGQFTWILGPEGLVSRGNQDRFPWEAGETPPPTPTPIPQPTATPKPVYPWYFKRPVDAPQMCGGNFGLPCLDSAPNEGAQYISGHVIDQKGAPVFGIVIEARNGHDGNIQLYGGTDNSGLYNNLLYTSCPKTPESWDVFVIDGSNVLSSYVKTFQYTNCATAGEFHVDFVEFPHS